MCVYILQVQRYLCSMKLRVIMNKQRLLLLCIGLVLMAIFTAMYYPLYLNRNPLIEKSQRTRSIYEILSVLFKRGAYQHYPIPHGVEHCSLKSDFTVFYYTPDTAQVVKDMGMTGFEAWLNDSHHRSSASSQACVLVVVVRKASGDLSQQLASLPHWGGNGSNHLVMNLSPDPLFTVDPVQSGNAAVAQSTFLSSTYRAGYDVIIPPNLGVVAEKKVWSTLPPLEPATRKFLLTFWGEYITPSNASHLPNAALAKEGLERLKSASSSRANIQLTCGTQQSPGVPSEWALCGGEKERASLLAQSTFALLFKCDSPEAVSTSAFQTRLVEALKSGAVPVLIGAEFHHLPFASILQWERAALTLHLHHISHLPDFLASFTDSRISALRHQGRFLWLTYFSSERALVTATLALLRTRLQIPALAVKPQPTLLYKRVSSNNPNVTRLPSLRFIHNNSLSLARSLYNQAGGDPFWLYPSTPFEPVSTSEALFWGSEYTKYWGYERKAAFNRTFDKELGTNFPMEQFTVVMLSYKRIKALTEALKRLHGLPYLNKVLVVWNDPQPPNASHVWPQIHVPVEIIKSPGNNLNHRFLPFDTIETDAIFSLDDDVVLSHKDILLGFKTWREERDRMVGFVLRSHYWSNGWKYTHGKQWVKGQSLALTGVALLHKYYLYLYSYVMPQAIRDHVTKYMNCEDIAMQCLVSHVTRKPPINVEVGLRMSCPGCSQGISAQPGHVESRSLCLKYFSRVYGYMPLVYTSHSVAHIKSYA